jgi:hypothetical protein
MVLEMIDEAESEQERLELSDEGNRPEDGTSGAETA